MKIAYILDWDIIGQSSVLTKISNKIQYWELKGHEVHLLVVSYKTNRTYMPKIKDIHVFERKNLNWLITSSLQTFIGRNNAFGRMLEELRSLSPDIVYLRPGSMWYPNVSRIVSSFPSILELNSIDEEEAKLYYPKGDIRYKIFKYGRQDLLSKCRGIVSLTHEINAFYSKYNKTSVVISNGVSIQTIHEQKYLTEQANIIFVGTPGQSWQGFDQFIKMARLLPEFKFHLVGPTLDNEKIPNNMICHGFLKSEDLDVLYKRCAVGVGTLALYKKNMNEACPLKVREYVANGLSLILGYIDTDFKDEPYTLYIGNTENSVERNFVRIRDFINNTIDTRRRSEKYDLQKYSVASKETQRLAFIEECYIKNTSLV